MYASVGWRLAMLVVVVGGWLAGWLPTATAACSRASIVEVCLFDAKQPTQNWHGPGESDCLIKTKHCDVC